MSHGTGPSTAPGPPCTLLNCHPTLVRVLLGQEGGRAGEPGQGR